MVKFILGSAGTGKTTIAHNILANLCKKGDNKLLMLVPDQSSFETENTFLNLLGPKLCRNILVFGFSRMSNYVFSQTGNLPDNVIDDGVRSIIMSLALDEVEDNLEMYSQNNNRRSVLDLMIHSLKECKKDNISTDMLRDVSSVIDDSTLCSKLQETALVLDSYDAIMSRSYIDPLDNLNRLKNILISNNIFKDYTIVVDSFSGFTYQQLEIIELLMKSAKDFYVTLNLDYSKRDIDLYFTTNRTYKLLKQIARKNDLKVENKTVL
ncbi:MAG: PD-(D/E)XK nuclease family protein, partial [Ruminococcus sp.]